MVVAKETYVMKFATRNDFQQFSKRFATTIAEEANSVKVQNGINRITGLWLVGCSGMCFGAVVLGNNI